MVLASGGYPDTYETGKVIHGIDVAEALPGINVFHSGTAKRDSDIVRRAGESYARGVGQRLSEGD